MNYYFARRIEAGAVVETKRRPLTANEIGVWLLGAVQDTSATSRLVFDAFPVFAAYNTRKQRTDAQTDFTPADDGAVVYESDSQTFYRYEIGVWSAFVPVAPPIEGAEEPPPTAPGITLTTAYSLAGAVPAEYAAYWNGTPDTQTVVFAPGGTAFVPFAPSQVAGALTLTVAANDSSGGLLALGFIGANIPDVSTVYAGGVSFEVVDPDGDSFVGTSGIFAGIVGGLG